MSTVWSHDGKSFEKELGDRGKGACVLACLARLKIPLTAGMQCAAIMGKLGKRNWERKRDDEKM